MTDTIRVPAVAPGRKPLLGHALQMKRRTGPFLLTLQSGDPVTVIQLGRKPMYVVNDPELIRQVLLDTDTFIRGGPITERFRSMFGNGLGISEGDFHRRQRALIQPAFHRNRIISYVAMMSELAEAQMASWRDGERLAFDEQMDELALAVVTRLMFGAHVELDRGKFMTAATTVLGGLFRQMTDSTGILTSLPTAANRAYRASSDYLRTTIQEVIDAYRADGTDRGDLLSMMLFARDEDGRPAMSDQQLHDEVMTFFIGGSNTVSNNLSWTVHELTTHPEVERRLYEEVDRVLGGRAAAYGDVKQLDYTRRVLTETLRARTQGLFLSRATAVDTELGGYAIPQGATVLYSFYALNQNPAIHSEPERFDPDRWLPERAKALPRGAFMPFSIGAHGCIGDQFAWTEMIVSLATIAARWRFVPVPGHTPRPKPAITMPVDALPMTVYRRDASDSARGV